MTFKFASLVAILASLACATAVTQKAHDTARIKYDLGVASLTHGDQRTALRELLSAAEYDPSMPEVHNALGLVYHSMGHLDLARENYHLAIKLNPKYSEAHNNLGTLELDTHHYDDAIASFKVALSDMLYATPYLAEGNMGWAYYQKGDITQAQNHIANAVATNPQFCRGYEWLTRIALSQNDAKEVVAQGNRFRKYCVDDARVSAAITPEYLREMQYYLAIGHLKQGDTRSARAVLSQCAVSQGDPSGFGRKCAESLQSLHR